jgi:hypothetical protein
MDPVGTDVGSQGICEAYWSIKIVGLTLRCPLEWIEESKSNFIQDIEAAVKILKYTQRFQSAVTLRGLLLGVSIRLCACTIRLNSVTLTLDPVAIKPLSSGKKQRTSLSYTPRFSKDHYYSEDCQVSPV